MIHVHLSPAPLNPSAFYKTRIIEFGFFMLKAEIKPTFPSLQARMENQRDEEPEVKAKQSWATNTYPATQMSTNTCPEIG